MATALITKMYQVLFVVFLALITELEAAYCRKSISWHKFDFSFTYCSYGCCGPSYHQTCCPFPTAVLIGCIAGGVALLAIVVAVTCCCCCCRRTANTGRIIQTSSGVPVVVQTGMTNTTCVTPMYPPSGGQASAPPPSYAMPPPSYSEVTRGKTPGIAYDNAGYT